MDYILAMRELLPRFSCVNWRSETVVTKNNVETCATELLGSMQRIWPREHFGINNYSDVRIKGGYDIPLTLLVTDLYAGSSGSYHRRESHERALNILEEAIQVGDFHSEAGVGGGTNSSQRLLFDATLAGHNDNGLRAMLLQNLCAVADFIVMCVSTNAGCQHCSRDSGSGFASGILSTRMQHLVEGGVQNNGLNRHGGVWDWGEKISYSKMKKSVNKQLLKYEHEVSHNKQVDYRAGRDTQKKGHRRAMSEPPQEFTPVTGTLA